MITSTENRQVKHILQLQKKARERKKEGLFVIEGIRMFRETPHALLAAVYASESFAQKAENRTFLEKYDYEILSDAVFAAVSDTQTPQGILALVKMPAYTLPQLLGETPHLLILESVQDPGNLGTMLRTGEGAGVTGVVMNRTTVDLFNPKTIRSTMGSIYRVPFVIADDLRETLGALRGQGISLYAAHLKGQETYDAFDYTAPCGFLIGNEGNGLSDETAACADHYVRIPMAGQVESLNAAVSAALLTYECSRQRRQGGKT